MNKFLIVLTLALSANCFAQTKSIYSKYFVKQNTVLLRWVPASKEVFDLAAKNGYRITRTSKENNAVSVPVLLAEKITPYAYSDSVKWNRLIQKNEKAKLTLKLLYENKNSGKIPLNEKADQEKMLYNLLLLSCDFDAGIATACGLYFRDSTISNTQTYVYKIEINGLPLNSKISSESIEVNAAVLSVNAPINNLSGSIKSKAAKLKWKAVDFTTSYGGYNVERSSDNSDFRKINAAPVILMSSQYEKNKEFIYYEDTVPDTKINYYYRIRGINNFGEMSEPSNVIAIKGYEELRSSPVIDTLKVINNRKVSLHWSMKDRNENRLLKDFILLRSEKDKGPYTPIYSSNVNFNFTDESPGQSNYYKVGAISLGNDTLYSYSSLALIVDTIPPSAPTGLQAKVDRKGNVELSWAKNPESDLRGYKIYKANSLHEEFTQMNDKFAIAPAWSDKLNLHTLTRNIYYAVVATDRNFNSSILSKPIEVKRPDTIAPAPALVKNIAMTQTGIRVSWIPSNSDDVKRYSLLRIEEKSNTTGKIKEWGQTDTARSFLDTTVEPGSGYRYKIVTTDEDSNSSVSNIPYMFFETGYRKKITNIRADADRTRKIVSLKWNYDSKEVEKFIIYRAKKEEPLTIVKTLSSPAAEFEDNSLNIGNTYEYRIKAVFKNAAESIISDAIRIEY